MEVTGSPLPTHRAQSTKERRGLLPGVALGLILKEYSEFVGLTSVIYRVLHSALTVCVVLGVQSNFYARGGGASAGPSYEALSTLVTPSSPYDQVGTQTAVTAVMSGLQSSVSTSSSDSVSGKSSVRLLRQLTSAYQSTLTTMDLHLYTVHLTSV